jgi:glycosyltransferase involved in cell wall biosynthesis
VKRVLFIAYLFPPINNSGTQRPSKFVKYLADYGWEPTIITAAMFDGHAVDQAMTADIPASARVVRVPSVNEQIAERVASFAGGRRIGRRLGHALSWRLQRRYLTPDMYALWKPTAMRAAMNIFNERGFDAIYATGYPWTSLLIGRDLSKATGRPLVADFRDLWAGERRFNEFRPPHDEELALEGSVLESAAAVVGASSSIVRQLSQAHPDVDEDKFIAIHNGFDAADFEAAAPAPTAKRFRIVFTGVWKDGYNPAQLYDSIDWIRRSHPALLDGVEVIATGFTPGEARRRGLTDYIDERGVVSHDEAVSLMRSADLLYLSQTDEERLWAVPGKLYEYLASGAPVLALTPPDCETGRIIQAVGGGIAMSPDDPGTLFEALEVACRLKQFTVPPRNPEALASFERRRLTAKLAAVLDDVAGNMPVPHTAFSIGAGTGASSMLATRSS